MELGFCRVRGGLRLLQFLLAHGAGFEQLLQTAELLHGVYNICLARSPVRLEAGHRRLLLVGINLHERLTGLMGEGGIADLLMVGKLREGPVGPHPLPQFEIHFLKRALPQVLPLIEGSGLRALVHPLTDDDLADHTTLAQWIGEPLALDLTTLDPPGVNQGFARFGKSDF